MSTIQINFVFENYCLPPNFDSNFNIRFDQDDPEMKGQLMFSLMAPDDQGPIVNGRLEPYDAKQLRDFLNYALKDL